MSYSDNDLDIFLKLISSADPEDLVILDLRGLDSVSDFFIICHGRSSRQVIAIAEYMKINLKKNGIRLLNFEGIRQGRWVILDYGFVVVHIFQESVRDFYNLEGLWLAAEKFFLK